MSARRRHALHLVVPVEGGVYDPLWDLEVELSPLELRLLSSPLLTRLHRVAHAGASALTTAHTYSRLEHVLGVLVLAERFAPGDRLLRAAALLHDVGHLPLSHTLEGIGGASHRAAGRSRLRAAWLGEALREGGLDPEEVEVVALGRAPSLLCPGRRRLGLDHLDSFVRAGRVHGWLQLAAPELLAHLHASAGALDGDATVGDELARLMVANAEFHAHPANVGPTAILRRAFRRLIASRPQLVEELGAVGDERLWAWLDDCEATRAEVRRLLSSPGEPAVVTLHRDEPPPPPLEGLTVEPSYVYAPVSAPTPAARRELARAGLLPTRFAVGWPEEAAPLLRART